MPLPREMNSGDRSSGGEQADGPPRLPVLAGREPDGRIPPEGECEGELGTGQPGRANGECEGEVGSGGEAGGARERIADATRIRLVMAYDGGGFKGFAPQPGLRTVAGELARAFDDMNITHSAFVCAGRTDAGVHARGQVVHVDVAGPVDPGRLTRSLNRMLGSELVVSEVAEVGPDFDARHSAKARHYRYLIQNGPVADPLLARSVWNVPAPLDLAAMRSAADAFVGVHDFAAFCKRRKGSRGGVAVAESGGSADDPDGPAGSDGRELIAGRDAGEGIVGPDGREPIVREVLFVALHEESLEGIGVAGGLVVFEISARSFCHQMVRSIVGSLVWVALGRCTPADVYSLLRSGDRSRAIAVAPPQGLCLMRVDY